MTVEITKIDQDVLEIVQKAVQHPGNVKEELIPILSDVNRSIGYLPMKALEEISLKLQLPQSHVLHIGSIAEVRQQPKIKVELLLIILRLVFKQPFYLIQSEGLFYISTCRDFIPLRILRIMKWIMPSKFQLLGLIENCP